WTIKQIITRRTSAVAPFSLKVGPGIISANLLAMAINTAIRYINPAASFSHSRFWNRIRIVPFFVRLRIEMPNLVVRHQDQPNPRKHKGAKDAEEERCYPFHNRASRASSSFGLRNVGRLALRPNPSSISPK